MKASTMQPDTLLTAPNEIPQNIQVVLNSVAFLIAAVVTWYAYFIKGKRSSSNPGAINPQPLQANATVDPETIRQILFNVIKISDAQEAMLKLMQKGAIEAEIARRVKEELAKRDQT